MPVVGAKATVPLAFPPILVISLLATGKKSSFDNTLTVLVNPNGAVNTSLTAVATCGFKSVSFGLPSLSQSKVFQLALTLPITWSTLL